MTTTFGVFVRGRPNRRAYRREDVDITGAAAVGPVTRALKCRSGAGLSAGAHRLIMRSALAASGQQSHPPPRNCRSRSQLDLSLGPTEFWLGRNVQGRTSDTSSVINGALLVISNKGNNKAFDLSPQVPVLPSFSIYLLLREQWLGNDWASNDNIALLDSRTALTGNHGHLNTLPPTETSRYMC